MLNLYNRRLPLDRQRHARAGWNACAMVFLLPCQKGFTNYVDRTDRHEQSLETRRFVAIETWIVASKKLTFKSVRFEQNIPGDPLSFHLQELPQPVHSLHYALMHHNVTSCDLDELRALRTKALNSVTGYLRLSESAKSNASVN